mgnify:CR=1 FL=1
MIVYILGALSLLLNWLLIWYVIRLLRKFYFISENLADLFLTTKAFRVFVQSLYGMDSYHGEPIIQELLDEELEEELNAAEEEAQKVN